MSSAIRTTRGWSAHRGRPTVAATRQQLVGLDREPAVDSSSRALDGAGATWTAVTLYSGQLVAQSEFSVVTTLAPVTGWWNVV